MNARKPSLQWLILVLALVQPAVAEAAGCGGPTTVASKETVAQMKLVDKVASHFAKAPKISSRHAWTANEVSMLLPLPEASQQGAAIRLSYFMDESLYKQAVAGRIAPPHPIPDEFGAMHLLGVRIDPCFRDTFESICEPQIRMIWQPLETQGGQITTVDAALHTFHPLSAKQLNVFLDDLWRLNSPHRKTFDKSPDLGVHPVLAKEGYQSKYASDLKDLLSKTVGGKKPSRVTAMTLHAFDSAWEFFAVDTHAPADDDRMVIPDVNSKSITFQNLFQRPKSAAFPRKLS